VYSYVPTSTINSFSGDVKAFFTYLISNQGFSSSQYLVSVGAGSEPTTGSNAVFTVSKYSMVIS
jgi:xyloglucan-specific endo-beta-1,4-glucanase